MMRAPLALAFALTVAACSGTYGEEERILPPTASTPRVDKPADKPLEPTPTTEGQSSAPPKKTTFVNCEAALSTIETCARNADVLPIGTFASLKTKLRPNELSNQCLGCDDQPCQMCHHSGKTRIFDYNGVWVPIHWVLGCEMQPDGTVGVARTSVLESWEMSVAGMPDYGAHPFFTLTPAVRAARDDTAALITARLAKGECRP